MICVCVFHLDYVYYLMGACCSQTWWESGSGKRRLEQTIPACFHLRNVSFNANKKRNDVLSLSLSVCLSLFLSFTLFLTQKHIALPQSEARNDTWHEFSRAWLQIHLCQFKKIWVKIHRSWFFQVKGNTQLSNEKHPLYTGVDVFPTLQWLPHGEINTVQHPDIEILPEVGLYKLGLISTKDVLE